MALNYINRKGTNSVKWDNMMGTYGDSELLPMWIADMDFDNAPCIKEALKDYMETGPFGYYLPPDEYYEAIIRWEKEKHGFDIEREWICFAPTVAAAFYWLILMSTRPGDGVLLLTPVYYPMQNAIRDNDRKLVSSELIRDGNTYRIDFDDFESQIVKNNVKLFILCSPHNPVGRVWSEEELKRIMKICRMYGVLVISDEIHKEFCFNGHVHKPVATLGNYEKNLITLGSASKAFNIASCGNSYVIIPDAELRARYKDFTKRINIKGGNSFGYVAVTAALTKGDDWLKEVNKQIWENYLFVKENFEKKAPSVTITDLQGTYLLWLDFSAYFSTQKEIEDFMQTRCGLAFDYGSWFGGEKYAPFVRMNLATNEQNIQIAVAIILSELKKLEKNK